MCGGKFNGSLNWKTSVEFNVTFRSSILNLFESRCKMKVITYDQLRIWVSNHFLLKKYLKNFFCNDLLVNNSFSYQKVNKQLYWYSRPVAQYRRLKPVGVWLRNMQFRSSKSFRETAERKWKAESKQLNNFFFALRQNWIGRQLANTVRVPGKKRREKKKENLKYHKFAVESDCGRICVCKDLQSRLEKSASSCSFKW